MPNEDPSERHVTIKENRESPLSMKLKELTPMLSVTDVEETVRFYTERLGFTCESFEPALGWASVRRDDVAIMFALPNGHEPFDRPILTGSLYMRSDNIDELWEQLREKTAIVYPLEDFHYGMREFAVRDNNGYILQFGQDIPPE